MTSSINPNNIDGAYPVAGQDNNSQGFRDNFTNTSTNFQYAADEITDIQNKGIFTTALTGSTLNNNMLYSPLTNAQIAGFSETSVNLGTLSGTIPVNYTAGHYQIFTTAGVSSLSFTNWPAAGQLGWVTVQVNVASTAHTLTLPTAVSVNAAGIPGINTSTNVITFAATGTYSFIFTTYNNGTTITVNQTNYQLAPLNAAMDSVGTGNAVSLTTGTSYFTTAGTATLAAGVQGEVKVLAQTANASMVITVANPAWGGAGNITLNAPGEAVTLQYINNKWLCIGNNGATFA